MIRFAWLQFRVQAIVAGCALSIVAIVLAVTEPHILNLYDSTVLTCKAHLDCGTATTSFLQTDGPIYAGTAVLLLTLPALIGMFWGAPLAAREFETGTFRLAWTQGVTRTRWVVVKLGFGVVASALTVGLLSLMTTWWASKIDLVRLDSYNVLLFSSRDIVPVGYAVFAFVLGFSAGLILRRTLPAMTVAIAGFVAARLAVIYWVRPHLIAPWHKDLQIGPQGNGIMGLGETQHGVEVDLATKGIIKNAWIYSNELVDKAGRVPTQSFLNRACPFDRTNGQFNMPQCISNLAAKYHQLVTYQPASHLWAFEWYETGIFVGFAVVLGGLALWRVRFTSS